ncbi:2-dehydropantoate 2-reductase N-terminal domain-containing protein [Streptomyces sp. NPDC003717]|uniref:ketopantoate reductase family protein n=1 Tax=Streptomyces sp. NPDC003717 TaxID=3154276 RepID=UPI0033BF9C09
MRRYVVVGAGAVGSAMGGLLARAGREVLLVARGEHARVAAAKGLRLRCPDGAWTVPVPVVTGPEQVRLTTDDVLLLTVKTQQAEAAVEQWADVPVHDGTGRNAGRAGDLLPLLTALNGVAAEDIALRRFSRVFGVCVWCPTVMTDPGEVLVRGVPVRGIFHVGRYGGIREQGEGAFLDDLVADADAADLRVLLPDDVMPWKYAKLLANLGNVLQALLGDTSGAEDVLEAARSEARAVLAAAGVVLPGEDEARAARADLEVRGIPGEPARLGGSSWQSLTRGTGNIETDYLNGEIVLMARRLGLSAPVNAGLTALARAAARARHRPGDLTPAELRSRLAR